MADKTKTAADPAAGKAAEELLTLLASVDPWERFPADVSQWTPSQRRQRMVPPRGRVLLTWCDRDGVKHRRECPRNELAQAVDEAKRQCQGLPMVRLNAIDERVGPVEASAILRTKGISELRRAIEYLVPDAVAAVLRAGGRAEPLRELERDAELHCDTVAQAMVELQRVEKKTTPKVGTNKSAKAESTPPVDVKIDPVCVSIRRALSKQSLLLKPLVTACKPASRRTVTERLRWLSDAEHVEQIGNRGPYRLADAGRIQQRHD